MLNQKIFWFQDGAKLALPVNHWHRLDLLTEKLIRTAGHPDFTHLVIDPLDSFKRLFNQLIDQEFSCVIDLTGFLGYRLKDIFPATDLVNNFHLSRLRLVSSSRLDGVGFLLSLNSDEVNRLKNNLDLKHPLIVDDISWSGRTVIEAQRILGFSADSTTIGLLVGNRGEFGQDKPGAVNLLANKGFKVVTGDSVLTPLDDGFHIADFFNHRKPETIFNTILLIQEMRQNGQPDCQIKEVIENNVKELFPDAFNRQELLRYQEEGRLVIKGGLAKDGFFAVNPLNWLMPSFAKRVRSQDLNNNREELISVLKDLKELEVKPLTEFEVSRANVERL